jgi:hypothetical protein
MVINFRGVNFFYKTKRFSATVGKKVEETRITERPGETGRREEVTIICRHAMAHLSKIFLMLIKEYYMPSIIMKVIEVNL